MSKPFTEINKLVIEVPVENGKLNGVALDDKLMITQVGPGCHADGKLAVNDRIAKLNNAKLSNTVHFYTLLRAVHPVATLTLFREEKKIRELETKLPVPKEREKWFKRRQGYTYHMVKIERRNGQKRLGLGIKCNQNSIFVAHICSGSLAVPYFAKFDRIIDIDSELVGHVKVARHLLADALKNRGYATCIVERPRTEQAKQRIKEAIA